MLNFINNNIHFFMCKWVTNDPPSRHIALLNISLRLPITMLIGIDHN
jgi:hypothetical protein